MQSRRAIAGYCKKEAEKLNGELELDETYFGGKRKEKREKLLCGRYKLSVDEFEGYIRRAYKRLAHELEKFNASVVDVKGDYLFVTADSSIKNGDYFISSESFLFIRLKRILRVLVKKKIIRESSEQKKNNYYFFKNHKTLYFTTPFKVWFVLGFEIPKKIYTTITTI